jgi:hypothetical protein
MMKVAALLLLALSGLMVAEEARPEAAKPADDAARIARVRQVARPLTKTPWLGLQVGRLDDALRAQLPNLPQGFGFVVTFVDAGGPAEQAGIQRHDVIWKFGDQWIANEAQIFALLRIRKEGDEVKMGVYRSGKELTLPVTLGKMPDEKLLAVMPGEIPQLETKGASPDMPMKELHMASRTAEIEAADGKAVLMLTNGVAEVKITTSGGQIIFEGPVTDAQGVSTVPDPWKPRVGALQRALTQTPRVPRPRVLPHPPQEEPSAAK